MPAGCRRNGRACGAAGASACRTGGRRAGQTLCILEAMKMMNEIEAPVSGQVVAIEAVPGELVSFGQTLVRILPR